MNRSLIRSMIILFALSGVLIGVDTVLRGHVTGIQDTHMVAGTTLGEPPVAIISYPVNNSQIEETATFRFDGSTSYDPDGGLIEYFWEADPKPDRWGSPPGSPEIRAFFNTRIQIPGNYTITLTVTDEEGLTDTTYIIIQMVRAAGSRATETTEGVTVETTVETTTEEDILTVRPNFLPGYSVISVIFALFIPVVLRRKMNK